VDNGLAMVAVAVVTAIGGVIVALIQGLRKENREDHAVVQERLSLLSQIAMRTENKVDTVKEELADHLDWHKGGIGGQVRRGTEKRRKSAAK
jgi:hypothetical protein